MSTRFMALALGLILSLGLLATPSDPNPTSETRVVLAWNSFVKQTHIWTLIRKNTLPVKGRSKVEMEAWERLKEKWLLVILEVEVAPHD